MRRILVLTLSILSTAALALTAPPSVQADEVTSESSSSSSTTTLSAEKKGYAFKYGERLKNWASQIDTGIAKGWLTAEEGTQFKSRLDSLRQVHESVSAKGYAKPDLDDMEKQFNQFNIDLSSASAKPKSATASGEDTKTTTTKKAVPAKHVTVKKTTSKTSH